MKRSRIATMTLFCLAVAAGCLGPRGPVEKAPDQRFGHRYEGRTSDGRETLVIVPPDTSRTYFYYPAVYDTVFIRPSIPAEGTPFPAEGVSVEVLVKGAFPDACHALHDVKQTIMGRIVAVNLEMRRPQGALCASVMRPYRYYFMLEGTYMPGNYTLKLNDEAHAFVVRAPVAGSG